MMILSTFRCIYLWTPVIKESSIPRQVFKMYKLISLGISLAGLLGYAAGDSNFGSGDVTIVTVNPSTTTITSSFTTRGSTVEVTLIVTDLEASTLIISTTHSPIPITAVGLVRPLLASHRAVSPQRSSLSACCVMERSREISQSHQSLRLTV